MSEKRNIIKTSQSARFIEAAMKTGADESGNTFEKVFKKNNIASFWGPGSALAGGAPVRRTLALSELLDDGFADAAAFSRALVHE